MQRAYSVNSDRSSQVSVADVQAICNRGQRFELRGIVQQIQVVVGGRI